jgi:hypothetical protein
VAARPIINGGLARQQGVDRGRGGGFGASAMHVPKGARLGVA